MGGDPSLTCEIVQQAAIRRGEALLPYARCEDKLTNDLVLVNERQPDR